MRALLILGYSLHLFWTGLWASISAQAFKQNAFWFCLVLGLCCLAGSFIYQKGQEKLGRCLVAPAAGLVLGFYAYSFVSDPAADATFRVGLIILRSIAVQLVLFDRSAKRK